MTKSRKSKNDLFSSLDRIFDGQLSISEMIDCAFSSSSTMIIITRRIVIEETTATYLFILINKFLVNRSTIY